MIHLFPGKKGIRFAVILLLSSILIAPLVAAGCGSSGTPEAGAKRYLKAMQDLNWEEYKASHKPGQKLTAEQEELAKQEFEQVKIKCEDFTYKTDYDKKDKNKAVVTVTGGKITYTADILGEEKTETTDIKGMPEEERPSFNMIKVKDIWYVDEPIGG